MMIRCDTCRFQIYIINANGQHKISVDTPENALMNRWFVQIKKAGFHQPADPPLLSNFEPVVSKITLNGSKTG